MSAGFIFRRKKSYARLTLYETHEILLNFLVTYQIQKLSALSVRCTRESKQRL